MRPACSNLGGKQWSEVVPDFADDAGSLRHLKVAPSGSFCCSGWTSSIHQRAMQRQAFKEILNAGVEFWSMMGRSISSRLTQSLQMLDFNTIMLFKPSMLSKAPNKSDSVYLVLS
ncbi:hypothetical protein GOP47_0001056 [Adiantum capillus-veneris]|uniref:Uncharacterized protein n=1 Tax=Adiantum capillus-veneris TaxID=13818 RepID=A0A9D4VEN1_ADICA|nr:hypothetical protein GOP47_0001056 [Adiantum capillus-veneris]